jgi:peptidoglycan hydrolase CwlO-like protein
LEKEILVSKDVVSSLQKANDQSQKRLDKFQGQIEDLMHLLKDLETKFQHLCLAFDAHNLKVHDLFSEYF